MFSRFTKTSPTIDNEMQSKIDEFINNPSFSLPYNPLQYIVCTGGGDIANEYTSAIPEIVFIDEIDEIGENMVQTFNILHFLNLNRTNNPENIKPLYGRQTYRGSNQWNYFTSLDSHLATKIPIYSGDKDCTEERGCQEINKNDMLNIGDPGKQYKANIYQTQAPRYIPYV